MKVYLYSGMQKMIEKSGVGRAIYHQRYAAELNGIGVTNSLRDADLIHINTVFPKSFFLAKKAKKMNIPVVYHAHSTKEDFKNSYLGTNLVDGLFGKWIKLCYTTSDVIITPSEYSKRLLLSYGIRKRIEVVSNGIDLDFFDKKKADRGSFRRKYGYSDNDKIIMSVGLTINRKGVEDFVELARRMPEYKFIWFGETDLNTVPAKTRKAVLTKLPNLKFARYAKRCALRDAYGSCDLFLFPSKEETEGIVVLEALAMEIPVLLRDIPVYSDWLKDGESVYKAEDVDSFEASARSILEGESKSLVLEGKKIAEDRSIDKVGARLGKVYRSVLASAREIHPVRMPASIVKPEAVFHSNGLNANDKE